MILFLLLLFTSSLTTHGTDLQMYGQDKLYGKVASKLPKQGGRAYKYLNYGEIEIELKRLAKLYPDLITVYSAQQEYNVPSPGSCGDAGPCKQWYARITNEKTLFVEDVIPTNSQTGPGGGPPGNGPILDEAGDIHCPLLRIPAGRRGRTDSAPNTSGARVYTQLISF